MDHPDVAIGSGPDYAPYQTMPFRLSMGLAPLDLHDWIEPDAQMAADLTEKARLLRDRHHEVFAALPGAAEGGGEVLALLASYLPQRFPDFYQRQGDWLYQVLTGQRWNLATSSLHPLDLAGRLVQEDLCLMQQPAPGETYALIGASVCFPTRWRLAQKIGRSLRAIHAPVPGYDEQLDSSMERFFQRLKVERPVWRVNWSLVDDPTLFQPDGHGRQQLNPTITSENAADRLWLRMERQTLRRLPCTGDILFTIRVYVRPLQTLTAQIEHAVALAAAIRALPPTMQQYKSLPPFLDAVLAWLDRVTMATPRLQTRCSGEQTAL